MPRNDPARDAPQADFAAALLDPDLPLPKGVVGPAGKSAQRRFAVYRNNVTVSLIDSLADIFPAVQRLVGPDFFRNMARVYLTEEPPASAVMFEYGSGFAAFLDRFEPVSKLPYLADVARLERAWLDVFHSTDVEPLSPEALGVIAPENLGDVRFTPHPAARIVRSRYAAVSIFSASREYRPLDRIRPLDPEDGLITRPDFEVQVRTLPPGAAQFFEALITGETLAGAATITVERHPGFDLPAAISAMLEAGVFSACSCSQAQTEQIT
ncbi:MAG: DNA-binding domain-containing protein [Hoeflea sp.]|uniref:HvfC/BufC N-terminal domain-containing protein n=1 Tax=Hoeflea sp. TaxID=1940281 RepID=UPI001DFB1A5D|nr:DNA-binding domain-containing protein [Hoeflea sp.]MBU4528222.1 DNA-binding domain-containing protein [Alphaproteobacteria bacterium]MBU4543818.1 DNA-binding domain-containing protein [Alphaproteobacteria bacterium]MBU4548459.1 DNA-binding domain-containing protein [Alphaproteobacteria bacterium]MBV1722538.1 DNA-binding domain-containing protein [Hoeflea sp.]MBV1762207.1 DNA-binding domain-containing protein [Hoeflea sp.]